MNKRPKDRRTPEEWKLLKDVIASVVKQRQPIKLIDIVAEVKKALAAADSSITPDSIRHYDDVSNALQELKAEGRVEPTKPRGQFWQTKHEDLL